MERKMEDITIQHEFERLIAQDPGGILRPEAVIEAAQGISHPLHNQFIWDDTEAARLYRIEQARSIIRSFKIEIPELKVKVRALTSLEMDRLNGGGYRWTMEVMQKPGLREELIKTALNELERVQVKYQHLTELADVWESIARQKQTMEEAISEPTESESVKRRRALQRPVVAA